MTVGVSYGGAVALHFALRHPDRVAGLVVVDSFAELEVARPMEGSSRLEIVRDSFDPTNLCQPGELNRLLAGFLHEIGW